LTNLRRKYDEVVSFSVNLTAERDILSNTLEHTKRDFNREMAARSALENKMGGGSGVGGSKGGRSMTGLLIQLFVVGVACFYSGIKMGRAGAIASLPPPPATVVIPPTPPVIPDVPPQTLETE